MPARPLVDDYLSEAHRDHPGAGCPVGALAGDIPRSDKRTRALFTRQIRDNIELVATLIRDTKKKNNGAARSQAVLAHLRSSVRSAWLVQYRTTSFRAKSLKTVAQLLKNAASELTPAALRRLAGTIGSTHSQTRG